MMVISVPHSGTRSLRDHLGLDGYWHWNLNDADINRYEGLAHIPVRDPFDISISWMARYPTEPEKNQKGLLTTLDKMIAYTHQRPRTQFHVIEELPLNVGKGPEHWAKLKKNRKKALKLDQVIELRRWMGGKMAFYERFYPKGFWWYG